MAKMKTIVGKRGGTIGQKEVNEGERKMIRKKKSEQ